MRENWASYRGLNHSRWPGQTRALLNRAGNYEWSNDPEHTSCYHRVVAVAFVVVSILVSFARTATRFPLCSAQLLLREVWRSVTAPRSLFSATFSALPRFFNERRKEFHAWDACTAGAIVQSMENWLCIRLWLTTMAGSLRCIDSWRWWMRWKNNGTKTTMEVCCILPEQRDETTGWKRE